jgi:hypothetical protein
MESIINASSAGRAWFLFGLSSAGMLVFAGLYFLNPKTSVSVRDVTQIQTNTVTNTIIFTVTNDVVREVEKIVNVPAAIPPEYVNAMKFTENMTKATFVTMDQVLFGMKDVRVECALADDVRQVVSVDEVRAKFELTLRRNNVPINPKSEHTITLNISGFLNQPDKTTLCFSIVCDVIETQWVARLDGAVHFATVIVWTKGAEFGTVGRDKASESLLKDVEKSAEIFANDYLSANPKPQ